MKNIKSQNIFVRHFKRTIALLFVTLFFAVNALSQRAESCGKKLAARRSKKNVTGESPDRNVAIYLPPGYDTLPNKRYPIVYLLHAIGDTESEFINAWDGQTDDWGTFRGLMNNGIAEHKFGETIIVMPDESRALFLAIA